MSTSHQFECRILAGLHQGARAALSPESDTHAVGRDLDADIVLRDLPVASGTVRIHPPSWTWTDPGCVLTLALGEALDLGGVTLQVCAEDAAWPASPDVPRTRRRQSAATADAGADSGTDSGTDPGAESGADSGADKVSDAVQASAATPGAADEAGIGGATPSPQRDAPATAARRLPFGATARRVARIAAGVGAVLTTCALLAGAWVMTDPGSDDHRSAAKAAETTPGPAASTEADLLAVEALIDEKQLGERVWANLNPTTGRIEISGVVASDEEFEDFVRAVRKSAARIALHVVTHHDFAAEVAVLQDELPDGIRLSTQPVGALVVSGSVSDDEARENLILQLQNLVPLAAEIYVEVKTSAELAQENRRNKPAATQAAPPPPRLMAVVSGPEPFVVLPNGERIMIGGMVNGLVLTAITSTHVDYQSADGRTIHAPR